MRKGTLALVLFAVIPAWAELPQAPQSTPEAPPSLAEASEIIETYGQLLNESRAGDRVSNASRLPYAKDRIKSAILVFLDGGATSEQEQFMTAAYTMLAWFQDGVEGDTVDPNALGPGGRTWRSIVTAETIALGEELSERRNGP